MSQTRVKAPLNSRSVAELNGLSRAVNQAFGVAGKTPLVNCGPCGRFAKVFRECWAERFGQWLNFVFVMTPDKRDCVHILVRLPDGNYFDGGLGVVSGELLKVEWFNAPIIEQTIYDLSEFEMRAHGLSAIHPDCPKYNDAVARHLVRQSLGTMEDAFNPRYK